MQVNDYFYKKRRSEKSKKINFPLNYQNSKNQNIDCQIFKLVKFCNFVSLHAAGRFVAKKLSFRDGLLCFFTCLY